MRKIITLVSLLAFAVPTSAQTQAQQIRVGQTVVIHAFDGEHTYDEIRIAADPTDASYFIACGIRRGLRDQEVVAFQSSDGGSHWTQTLVTPASSSDPECEFGNHGNVFVEAIALGRETDDIYWSGDRGRTWQKRVSLPFADRPALSIDRTNTISRDTIYLLGASDVHLDNAGKTNQSMEAIVYTSRDDGDTFYESRNLHYVPTFQRGPGFWQPSHPAILSDGTALYLTGADCTLNNNSGPVPCRVNPAILLYTSENHQTFDLSSIARPVPVPCPAMACYELARGSFNNVKDRLYVAYCSPVNARGDQTPYLISSDDRGKRWSKPLQIGPAHGICDEPMVAVNKNGVVGMTWYAGKASRHFKVGSAYGRYFLKDYDMRCDVNERFAASSDGGKTVLPSVIINPIPHPAPIKFVPSVQFFDDSYIRFSIGYASTGTGDTEGLTVASDGSFHPDWVDYRNGVALMHTARIDVLPNGSGQPPNQEIDSTQDLCRAHKVARVPYVLPPQLRPASDVTNRFEANMRGVTHDARSNDFTIVVSLRGPQDKLARGIDLELTKFGQFLPGSAFLNADNGVSGVGARWHFSDKMRTRLIRVHVPPQLPRSDSANFWFRLVQ